MFNPDSPTTRVSPSDTDPSGLHGDGVADESTVSDDQLTGPIRDIPCGDSTTRAEKQRATVRSFQPGESIDHFLLIRLLGEGGFGQVWLATDRRLSREVAIKLPHRRLHPETAELRRFQREAEISAKLTHPNLIPILEAVLDQDQAYIVSEYCPGPTLLQWLRDRHSAVPPRTAVLIVARLAGGLKLAHDRGLIHRDIKPSNIILTDSDTESPVPRLTDFGMARMMSDLSETRVGTLIGSGPYMSPEQASGAIDEHGPHSDVHALGILLYELLTNESPFAAVSELDTIRRIVSQDPPSVRQLRPSLSRDISAVCQRCLEKQPARRYRDAGELLADLNRVLAGDPPHARPVGRVGRTWRWATRNRMLATMATAALIGAVVGVTGLAAVAIQAKRHARRSEAQAGALSDALQVAENQRAQAEQQTHNAETERTRAIEQQAIAQTAHEQSRQTSYNSDVSLAFQRFHQGHYGEVRRLLDRQIPQSDEPELRTLEWWLLDSEVRSRYELWGHHAGHGTELAVIRSNETIEQDSESNALATSTVVSAATDGSLIFWDVATGRQQHRLDGFHGRLDAIATLPSGELLVSGPSWLLFGRSVEAIDPQTGKTREVFHSHPTTIDSIRVSFDGKMIASGCRYDGIRCWSTETARSVHIFNGARNNAFGLLRDGTRLITSRRNPYALQVFDTSTGGLIDQWVDDDFNQVAAANAHSVAAYNLYDVPGVGIVDATNLENRRWIDTKTLPNVMEFSPDDEHLAVGDARNGLELFERVNAATQPPGALIDYQSVAQLSGRSGRIEDVVFTERMEVVTVSIDGMVERFAPRRPGHWRHSLGESNAEEMFRTRRPAGMMSVNKDGQLRFFATDCDNTTNRNQPATTTPGHEIWATDSPLNSFAMSENRETIAVTDDAGNLHVLNHWCDEFGKLQTPDVRTIRMPRSMATHNYGLLVFSATGRYVATTGNTNQIIVYDLASDSNTPIARRWYENVQACLAFSSDEQFLFIGGYAGTDQVNLSTGKSQFRLPKENLIRRVAFSPQGEHLIVGLADGSLACLDQQTGAPLFRLHGLDVSGDHVERLAILKFMNENRLLTVNSQGELHFWDLEERLQLGSFQIHDDDDSRSRCRCLDISPSGDELIVGLDHSSVAEMHRWSWPSSQE